MLTFSKTVRSKPRISSRRPITLARRLSSRSLLACCERVALGGSGNIRIPLDAQPLYLRVTGERLLRVALALAVAVAVALCVMCSGTEHAVRRA